MTAMTWVTEFCDRRHYLSESCLPYESFSTVPQMIVPYITLWCDRSHIREGRTGPC
jgi:hypothetical protein